MNKCLVTKLNGTVDNPNIPIFEPVAQFTLDAITASGNNSMTDAQITALNHFFYKIGAIDNSSMFQKIKVLLLPFISNDNISTALMNYIGNVGTTVDTASEWSFDSHAVKTTGSGKVLTTKYSGSNWDLSYIVFNKELFNGANDATFKISVISDYSSYGAARTGKVMGCYIEKREMIDVADSTKYDIVGMNISTTGAYMCAMSSSKQADMIESTTSDISSRKTQTTFNNNNNTFYPRNAAAYASMLSERMTDSELKTVMNALCELGTYFK